MPFNSNQGYPQQPFLYTGPHNPAPFTQLRSYGAMVGMRYGSFERNITTVPVFVRLSGGGDGVMKIGRGDRVRKSSGGDNVRKSGGI